MRCGGSREPAGGTGWAAPERGARVVRANALPGLKSRRIRHTRAVFGLLQNSGVDETFITKLLPRLPGGDSELYSHPSLDEFRNEFDALINPRVRAQIDTQHIQLIRYQDL